MRIIGIVLLLIVAAEVCLLALAFASPEETLPADSDLPRKQRVGGWQEAASLARTDSFKPASEGAGGPKLTVRGIPGDRSRPLAAEYGDGLVIREAYVDADPQLEDEPAEVEGADRAWWGTVRGETYLYVRRDETLVILSGLTREDLIRTASSLEPVENG
ncbi:MAG TPA: hypothetical protein VJ827_04910 [Rubrobacter sp.]|nr:hypothetical protein [Rubrobacter sp.]